MKAKVIFHDGMEIGPTFVCDRIEDQRILSVIKRASELSFGQPGLAATALCAGLRVAGIYFSIHNTPTGRTLGGTLVHLQNPEFWPGWPFNNEAGVFFVDVTTGILEYWGGVGLPGFEPFTPTISQKLALAEVPDEVVDQDRDRG